MAFQKGHPNYGGHRFTKGNQFGKAHKGKRMSEETKRKIGEANSYPHPWVSKCLKGISGPKSHAWKGGKSFEPYGLEFNQKLKEQIRQRDQYRCQECFRHQNELKRRLDVHHIDYNKQNNKPENLIALCQSCHLQTGYDRNDWTDYFQNKTVVIK